MAAPGHNRFQTAPVTGALGAEISGIDLSQNLSDDDIVGLRAALLQHLVLFFRDQTLTPQQHIDFTRRFGRLHIHPIMVPMKGHPEIVEVIKEADETNNWGDHWHTDLTALPEPPMGSVLYAREVPPSSGDTQWCNMYLAYETLSAPMRRFLDGLTCIHSQNAPDYGAAFQSMNVKDEVQSSRAEHPLVRTHPETRKKALFLPRPGSGAIRDMSPAESDSILTFLRQHSDNPDYACRFRWKKNSMAFWDNRCTRHRVTADYFHGLRDVRPHRRHLHRVTVAGDRPM
jgi:taurine dioxygenase